MTTKMETVIAVLVIIAIITSASSLWYGFTVVSDVSKLTDSVADLAGSVADLATAVAEFKNTTEADLADIVDRVRAVEATLTPTITVVGPWSGAEMDAFLPVLARFEALSGINTKYRVLRAEDLATLLPAQFAAETAPGDVIFMWGWFIKEKGQEGHIVDGADLIDEADFLVGVHDQVRDGDAIYGGAYTGKVKPGFWYRKSFFEANTITAPAANATWGEFLAFLDDVAAASGTGIPIVSGDGVGWPLSDITEHFLITFGGPQLQRALINGTADWTTDPVRGIFEDRLVPLLEGNFSAPQTWDSTAITSWWDGDYGLYFMGSWITGMVDDPDDLGVIPLPNSTGFVFAADYFFIPTYTEHLEEAQELFKFLISEEAQRLQVQAGGHIATNVGVSLDWYPAVDKMVANVTAGKETLLDLDDTIGGEFQSTFWSELQALWVDRDYLGTALANIQAVAP